MKQAALLLAGALLAGCASVPTSLRIAPGTSGGEIVRLVDSQPRTIETLEARGTVAVESPRFSNTASFELGLRRPDSLRMVVNGPFGIHVASILVTPGRFLLYNSMSNEVTEGDGNLSELPGLVAGLELEPSVFFDAFCASRAFDPRDRTPDSVYVDDGLYVLLFRHSASWTRYTVDPAIARITKIERSGPGEDPDVVERYEYGVDDRGMTIPKLVQVSHTSQQSSLSLSFRRVTVNPPIENLAIEIPPDAHWRTLSSGQ